MADLLEGTGRASNGGARERGPVPVGEGPGSTIRTPTDIMRRRREREEAARLAAVTASGQPEPSSTSARPAADVVSDSPPLPLPGSSGRRRTSGAARPERSPSLQDFPPSPDIPAGPSAASQQPAGAEPSQSSRTRPNIQAQNQPRPVPAASGARFQTNPTASSSNPRPAPQPGSAAAGPSTRPAAGPSSQPGSISTFPHAFERWETLSSHWEGLTSYWIRRLESNTQELRREPLTQQLSRQVTDLSQAGANLFHAVVELQRLRASSERKFSRWFHETRKELERHRENEAQLEAQLKAERLTRTSHMTRMENMLNEHDQIKVKFQKMIGDKDRELDLSRGEARRAWEELGRRETEERERTTALRDGQAILVGGIQVVPTSHHVSRGHSVSGSGAASAVRPVTRDGQSAPPPLHGIPTAVTGEEQPSPSNTDPFAESTTIPQVFTTQPPTTNGIHDPSSAAHPTSLPSGFYQHQPTLLHQQPQQHHPHHSHHHHHHHGAHPATTAASSVPTAGVSSAGSEAPSWHPSEETNSDDVEDDLYEYDEHGILRRDEFGQPIIHRRGHVASDDEEIDVVEEIERERIMRAQQRYGATTSGVNYPSVPASTTSRVLPAVAVSSPPAHTLSTPHQSVTATAPPDTHQTYSTAPPADYEGGGYDWESSDPAQFPARPGRPLSDVVEVDEDQRSRVSEMSHATHKATASQASAGEGAVGGTKH